MPADTLTRDEVTALVAVAGNGRTANRNRALVVVMWRTGLRLAEVLALRLSDVDRRVQTIRVRRGKGNKARTVPLDPGAYELLRSYLEERAGWELRRGAPVFCTLVGRPLAQQYVRALLVRLAGRAALDKHVHPHMLRHTYAAELAREGVHPVKIQRLLGHANLQVTTRYLETVGTSAELIDVIRSRPPIDDNARAHVVGIATAVRGRDR